jgi:hypothetical protein
MEFAPPVPILWYIALILLLYPLYSIRQHIIHYSTGRVKGVSVSIAQIPHGKKSRALVSGDLI